jgi:hypothetical protein
VRRAGEVRLGQNRAASVADDRITLAKQQLRQQSVDPQQGRRRWGVEVAPEQILPDPSDRFHSVSLSHDSFFTNGCTQDTI